MGRRNSQSNSKVQKVNYAGYSPNNQVEILLQDIKEKTGQVVHIAITPRTTIELPAHLSEAERAARVDNYRKLHNSKI